MSCQLPLYFQSVTVLSVTPLFSVCYSPVSYSLIFSLLLFCQLLLYFQSVTFLSVTPLFSVCYSPVSYTYFQSVTVLSVTPLFSVCYSPVSYTYFQSVTVLSVTSVIYRRFLVTHIFSMLQSCQLQSCQLHLYFQYVTVLSVTPIFSPNCDSSESDPLVYCTYIFQVYCDIVDSLLVFLF